MCRTLVWKKKIIIQIQTLCDYCHIFATMALNLNGAVSKPVKDNAPDTQKSVLDLKSLRINQLVAENELRDMCLSYSL